MPPAASPGPRILWIAAFLAAAGLPAAPQASPQAPDPLAGLEALRAGRFGEARAAFDRMAAQEPRAPEGPFFQAFHTWWRLLDRTDADGSRELRIEMESRLQEAASRAAALAEDGDPAARERGLVYTGVSLFLDAESKVARGSPIAAASSVRRGHRALTQALASDPGSADALFAMGTYNYYADHVSLLVKGLRFFLAIPGGDETAGIAQLEEAAARSRIFGTESLLLLAHIFSGNYAHDYQRALRYLDQAAARHPSSPLLALIQADLRFRFGDVREAAERAEAARAIVSSTSGYADDLRWLAEYRAAACALALHDPLEALRRAEAGLAGAPPPSLLARRRWISLLAVAARESGAAGRAERWVERLGMTSEEAETFRRRLRDGVPAGLAYARADALHALASGSRDDALRRLQDLLAHNPEEARLRYDVGRLLQEAGRLDEARPHLRAALDGAAGVSGADIRGRALLRLGWDLERSGRRPEAIELYHRAADLRSFLFRDAARDLMEHPARRQPEV